MRSSIFNPGSVAGVVTRKHSIFFNDPKIFCLFCGSVLETVQKTQFVSFSGVLTIPLMKDLVENMKLFPAFHCTACSGIVHSCDVCATPLPDWPSKEF